jgi:hypothetical protein
LHLPSQMRLIRCGYILDEADYMRHSLQTHGCETLVPARLAPVHLPFAGSNVYMWTSHMYIKCEMGYAHASVIVVRQP